MEIPGGGAPLFSWRCWGPSPVQLEMPLLDPQFLGPAGSLVHFDEQAFCASASGSGWGLEERVARGPG